MNIKHHLDEATLMSYAAGSLSQAMALVVACHLSMCKKCRKSLEHHQAIGGALLEEIPPSNISENALDEVLAKLDAEEPVSKRDIKENVIEKVEVHNDIPYPLCEYIGYDFSKLPWKKLGSSISYYDIPCASSGVSRLLKISPGCSLLPHSHEGNELTLVLSSSFSDEIGRFQVGDIADLDGEITHQPLVDSDVHCICLVATDAPLKFSSLLGKIMQPLTGF